MSGEDFVDPRLHSDDGTTRSTRQNGTEGDSHEEPPKIKSRIGDMSVAVWQRIGRLQRQWLDMLKLPADARFTVLASAHATEKSKIPLRNGEDGLLDGFFTDKKKIRALLDIFDTNLFAVIADPTDPDCQAWWLCCVPEELKSIGCPPRALVERFFRYPVDATRSHISYLFAESPRHNDLLEDLFDDGLPSRGDLISITLQLQIFSIPAAGVWAKIAPQPVVRSWEETIKRYAVVCTPSAESILGLLNKLAHTDNFVIAADPLITSCLVERVSSVHLRPFQTSLPEPGTHHDTVFVTVTREVMEDLDYDMFNSSAVILVYSPHNADVLREFARRLMGGDPEHMRVFVMCYRCSPAEQEQQASLLRTVCQTAIPNELINGRPPLGDLVDAACFGHLEIPSPPLLQRVVIDGIPAYPILSRIQLQCPESGPTPLALALKTVLSGRKVHHVPAIAVIGGPRHGAQIEWDDKKIYPARKQSPLYITGTCTSEGVKVSVTHIRAVFHSPFALPRNAYDAIFIVRPELLGKTKLQFFPFRSAGGLTFHIKYPRPSKKASQSSNRAKRPKK